MAGNLKETVKKKIDEHNIEEHIASFLYMIADNSLSGKSEKDHKNELVASLFEAGFEIHDSTGTKKLSSKMLQQVMWRLMSKSKFLSTTLHCTGKDENTERLTTEGLMTVAKKGNLQKLFAGKAGVLWNAFMRGDGYIMMGKGETDEAPIAFTSVKGSDVYADTYATGIRGTRPTNKLAVIHQYDLQYAYNLWPELEKEGIYGRIPGTYDGDEKNSNIKENEIVEICRGWNLAKKQHSIFAGVQAYSMDNFEGEEYPAIKNKKTPYIPVFQFLCMPSDDSFYNHGIGEMVYDLAIITKKLLNMEIGHIEENVYPITLLNTPKAKSDEIIAKMAMAHQARADGGTAFVAMEYGQEGNTGVQAQSLLTQNLFNEWDAIWRVLYKELSRLGINVDDIERGSGITRGQVVAEEEASNAFVSQMGEYNSWETEELIECMIDGIKEYVSNGNKTPLNIMTNIKLPDGTTESLSEDVTMGQLSKTLKNGNWFGDTDKRSGHVPSDLTKMLQEERLMGMTPPGTPEYNDLRRRIAARMGIESNVAQEVQAPQEGGAPAGEAPPPLPGQTQRQIPAPLGDAMQPI